MLMTRLVDESQGCVCIYGREIALCTRSHNFGTSPEIRHQSTSAEPVRKSHHAHPQFQPHEKKTVQICLSDSDGTVSSNSPEISLETGFLTCATFTDYDQSGVSVFPTSVDNKYAV